MMFNCRHAQCADCFRGANNRASSGSRRLLCALCDDDAVSAVCAVPSVDCAILFGQGWYQFQGFENKGLSNKELVKHYLRGASYFEECARMDPSNKKSFFAESNTGRCYFEAGSIEHEQLALEHFMPGTSFSKCVGSFLRANELIPTVEAYYKIGLVHMLARDPVGALYFVDRALALWDQQYKTGIGRGKETSRVELEALKERAIQHKASRPKKRFAVGERVQCIVNRGWMEGLVVAHDYEEYETHNEFFRTAEYQVRLYENSDGSHCDDQMDDSKRLVMAPFDFDIYIKAVENKPIIKKMSVGRGNRDMSVSALLDCSKILPLLKSMVPLKLYGNGWLDRFECSTMILNYAQRVASRMKGGALEKNQDIIDEAGYARKIADLIGTDTIPELLCKADKGDAVAMLRAADTYQYAFQMEFNERQSEKAGELYMRAAEAGHPEGCIAEAILRYFSLVVSTRTSAQNMTEPPTIMSPIPLNYRSMDNRHFYNIVTLLERAAMKDHACPFMILFIESHMASGSPVVLPLAMRTLFRKHQEQLSIDYREEKQERRSKCGFPKCPSHTPSLMPEVDRGKPKYSLCGKCKAVAYCCRDHQVQDHPRHKKECKMFLKMEGITFRSSDPEIQEGMKLMQQQLRDQDK